MTALDMLRSYFTFSALAARKARDRQQEGAVIGLQPAHGLPRCGRRPKADDIFRRGNGQTIDEAGPLSQPCDMPCPENMHEGALDCPFQSCPMRGAA